MQNPIEKEKNKEGKKGNCKARQLCAQAQSSCKT